MKCVNEKLIFAFLAMFAFSFLSSCDNFIMARWWLEHDRPDYHSGGGIGGAGGSNFGIVSFDAGGGTPDPKDLRIAWGNTVGRLLPMIRADATPGAYGFAGWVDENNNPWDVETRQVQMGDDVDRDGFIQLRAVWTAGTVHAVRFETRITGVPDPDPQFIANGGRAVAPRRVGSDAGLGTSGDGRYFSGWYTFEGLRWDFSTPIIESITLYAGWGAYSTRTVELVPNGGTRPTDGVEFTRTHFTVPLGSQIQDPGPLAKEGHAFGGWFTTPAFVPGTEWDFSTPMNEVDITPGVNPFMLYAKWVLNVYIVRFDVRISGIPNPPQVSVQRGQLVERPIVPSYQGMIVVGWYADFDRTIEWDFNQPVTSSMTLHAEWMALTLPPDVLVSQVRIIRVDFIDFAGSSTIFNQQSAGGASNLSNMQILNNTQIIVEVAEVLSDGQQFFAQLSGHANPVSTNITAERPELEAISRARAQAVIDQLLLRNIPAERLINAGYNDRNFAQHPDHARLNRCVEIVIIEILSPAVP